MTAALPGDLACKELVELATEYLEGALAAGERTCLELHLIVCPGCAAFLRQLRSTIGAARRLRGRPLSDAMREWLRAAFRERAGSPDHA